MPFYKHIKDLIKMKYFAHKQTCNNGPFKSCERENMNGMYLKYRFRTFELSLYNVGSGMNPASLNRHRKHRTVVILNYVSLTSRDFGRRVYKIRVNYDIGLHPVYKRYNSLAFSQVFSLIFRVFTHFSLILKLERNFLRKINQCRTERHHVNV